MDWTGFLIFLAVIGYFVYLGYKQESAPPLTLKDSGGGVMEPICPRCQTRLVTHTRTSGGGIANLAALLIGLVGLALFLFHWIAGAIVLILALLVSMAGRGKQTVLTCPACGTDAKTLH